MRQSGRGALFSGPSPLQSPARLHLLPPRVERALSGPHCLPPGDAAVRGLRAAAPTGLEGEEEEEEEERALLA